MRIALITGITGQDGSYLAELLLSKGYEVHGLIRKSSTLNTERIDHLLMDDSLKKTFKVHYGDLTDSIGIIQIIQEIKPDEIYNLGAMSHVKVSFSSAEYTANVDAIGTLRILEAIRIANLEKKTKFYQASTSELYGLVQEIPQKENTPFYPRSPYGVAKLYSYWITINYRESYGIYACNGILFNHESPRRGEDFVTRKITKAVASIVLGLQNHLYLGNLDAKRDWGYAKEYVEGIWQMLQLDKPSDFILATGKVTTVRDFVNYSFENVGIELEWQGERGSINEFARNKKNKDVLVKVDPELYRPTEVDLLQGDPAYAKKILGWQAETNVKELCKIMVNSDLKKLKSLYGIQGSLYEKRVKDISLGCERDGRSGHTERAH